MRLNLREGAIELIEPAVIFAAVFGTSRLPLAEILSDPVERQEQDIDRLCVRGPLPLDRVESIRHHSVVGRHGELVDPAGQRPDGLADVVLARRVGQRRDLGSELRHRMRELVDPSVRLDVCLRHACGEILDPARQRREGLVVVPTVVVLLGPEPRTARAAR